MLYELIRKFRGKETIVMRDEFKKVKEAERTYKDSGKINNQSVQYSIRVSTSNEKYRKPKQHERY
jgi:hypothetical protein